MAYIVSLKEFDGPLDLLLTLISNAKIDIHDIFVSQITEQYLETMSLVDELDMDSASEFLQMAATLLEIKSRAMLPKPPKPEDPEELSPEEALIKQLEEYPLPPPNIEITGLTLEKLIRAYRKVLERAERAEADDRMASREIRRDSFTVAGCMARISRSVRRGGCRFSELFGEDFTRQEVVTMFLALLELIKLNRLHVQQTAAYEEIMLTA